MRRHRLIHIVDFAIGRAPSIEWVTVPQAMPCSTNVPGATGVGVGVGGSETATRRLGPQPAATSAAITTAHNNIDAGGQARRC